jgi:hypothetical protein
MPANAALFLFLAAAVVSVFAFCSIVVWVTFPARERQARDRAALLKTLAEQPGDNARQILDMLREEDARRIARKAREERQGWISGGVCTIAVGVALGVMTAVLDTKGGTWSVGLIPLLIGLALLGVGLSRKEVQ